MAASSSNSWSDPRSQPPAWSTQRGGVELDATQLAEVRVELGRQPTEQRRLPEHVFDRVTERPPVVNAPGHTGPMPERIADATDPRLADYRELKDAAARRRIEGDELFIAEGPTAIERLLASGHRVRSVLVSEREVGTDARPARTASTHRCTSCAVELLHDIVGFDLHRGAIAAADRRPCRRRSTRCSPPHVASPCSKGSTTPRTSVRSHARRAPSASTRSCSTPPASTRTRDAPCGSAWVRSCSSPACRVADDDWPAAAFAPAPRRRVRDVGDDPRTGQHRHLDARRCPSASPSCSAPRGPGCRAARSRAATRRVRLPIHPDVDSLNVGAAAAVAFAVVGRGTLQA